MPTYLYKCPVHDEFECTHSINDKLEHCPRCDSNGTVTKVERLISSTNFALVGQCWAKDNYK